MSLAPQSSHMTEPQAAEQYAYFASLFDYSQLDGTSLPQATNVGSTVSSRVMSPVDNTPALSFFNGGMESQMSLNTGPRQDVISLVTPSSYANDMFQDSSPSSGAPSPASHQQHPSFGQEAFHQYFNLDIQGDLAPLDFDLTSPRSTSGHSQSIPVLDHNSQRMSPTQASYVPPGGAAHSGTRRVAGSWRPPCVESDSHVERSSSGTWSYPVATRN